MKIKNITPHTVVVFNADGSQSLFPPERDYPTPRVQRELELVELVGGVEVVTRGKAFTTGLPDPEDNTLFIVSSVVLSENRDRGDLLSPNDPVKDPHNPRILMGCRGFQRWRGE